MPGWPPRTRSPSSSRATAPPRAARRAVQPVRRLRRRLAFARVSTLGIREGWWPFGNVSVGGRHIHHFVPGILLAFGSGAAGLISENETAETTLAIPFGVGVGLTFDEAALLLDLRDVYWSEEGVLSLQVSLAAASFLRR